VLRLEDFADEGSCVISGKGDRRTLFTAPNAIAAVINFRGAFDPVYADGSPVLPIVFCTPLNGENANVVIAINPTK